MDRLRVTLTIPLMLLISLPALAQPNAPQQQVKTIPKPAANPQGEIQQMLAKSRPELFPNAAKVTIHDYADAVVRPDGSARTTTRMTVRLFTPRARDEGEIKIPYNGGFETIKLIRARTIRPDGSSVAVKPEDVRSAAPSDYDDARILSFSMPAVEPGCILDYEYVTDQKASQMPGQFWSQWYFQSGFDPVLHTKLTVRVPKTLKLQTKMVNSNVKAETKDTADGKSTLYTWEDKNIGPRYTEPLMPDIDRTLPKLTYSTIPNWQAIAGWYETMAEGREVPDAALTAKAKEITANAKTLEEKTRAIFYWVQNKTRYVAIELGQGAYQPRAANNTFVNQYGDCKDMATLLVSMLRAVGVTAHPVLLEAGAKYKTSEELPSPSAFNHAICLAEIDGKQYWLDATAEICAFGQIPGADRGVEALVLKNGKGEFITIPEGGPDDAESTRTLDLTLNPDGSASGTMTVSGTGDYELSLRGQLLATPPDKLGNLGEVFAQGIAANGKVSEIKISDAKNLDSKVSLTMKVSFPAWATKSGDLLLFKARPDQTAGQFSNPLSREDRTYPIVSGNHRRIKTELHLSLPDGFSALSLPTPTALTSPLGTFNRAVDTEGGKKISIKTTIIEKRAEVPPSGYGELRNYFDAYLKAYDESVILKKS
ncbi:MAG: DUF3857 and transglutaminase domain-containing protein [Armatimonas sp.]